MLNFFRRKNKHQRKGIPTADEKPRIASTVTTRLSENGIPIPDPEPEPDPEPVLVKTPEVILPGPDVLPTHTSEIDAKFANKSPEELCGIDITMTADEIRSHLAKLFTRHNRAASSFDLELRAEAELMLQAMVSLRAKYLEPM